MLEETGDEQKAQGWTPFILDTNGDGKRGEYTEPNQPFDPEQGPPHQRGVLRRVAGHDGTVWGSSLGFPGYVVRLDPTKPNPSTTALAEIYEVPAPGYGPRGFDIDTKGVAWVPLSSGHMASFDRSKCKVLNGPTIRDGKHCPEGWTLYPFPGPKLSGDPGTGSAEASYYTWVDQHDILGLGKDMPFATGNQNESLIALKDGKMINIVVPYPMGFYAKTFDGRIDDANAGWKGRGIWALGGQPHAVPRRRQRQGRRAEADEVPASSGSARALSRRRKQLREKPARLARAGRVCFDQPTKTLFRCSAVLSPQRARRARAQLFARRACRGVRYCQALEAVSGSPPGTCS